MTGTTPPSIRVFRARQQVRVRRAPLLRAEHVRWLAAGEQITVDAASRTEAGGYIWWLHACGLSAERRLGSDEIYLQEAASGLLATSFACRFDALSPVARGSPHAAG